MEILAGSGTWQGYGGGVTYGRGMVGGFTVIGGGLVGNVVGGALERKFLIFLERAFVRGFIFGAEVVRAVIFASKK